MKSAVSALLLLVLACSAPLTGLAQTRKGAQSNKPVILPVRGKSTQFASTDAYTDGTGGTFVVWQMEVETNNAGFYVFRTDSSGKHQISKNIIGGSAYRVGDQPLYGERYTFFDEFGDGNAVYTIEALQLNGKRSTTKPFAPTFVSDLNTVEGFTPHHRIPEGFRATHLVENDLNVSQELAAEIAGGKKEADINTHLSVIAQPGVRIGVRREGFYRVLKSELQTAGFDVNGDPSLWQLYDQGVEQAIIVGPNAEYIEFLGKGVDTPETDIRTYYLVTGAAAGKRIATRVARPAAGTVTARNYFQTFVFKERTNYINDILNGDAENYFGVAVGSGSPSTVTFNLSGIDFNNLQSKMNIRIQGFSAGTHVVSVSLNGHPLDPVNGSGRASFTRSYTFDTAFLVEGANNLVLQSVGPSGDFSFFDSINIDFGRKHLADQNKIKFFTQNFRRAVLDGFNSANIRVFDTTFDAEPILVTNLPVAQNGATFGVTMPAAKGRLFYAVEDSAVLSVASVSPNNPAMLSNPADSANMIIISYKDWMTQAENWADYRRGQGFTVKVVDVSEIYDEFNYGVFSADAIKSYLQYTYTMWQVPPQYVLFLGDASYDARNYQGIGFFNFVPTRIVNTPYTETGSDEFMADFNNDGLAEMAVGRIAARSAQSITNILARTVAYEQNLSAQLERGAVFAYDFNVGYDFAGMSNRLKDKLPASVVSEMIFRGQPNAHPTLISAMNTGKLVVNYSGHGSIGTWAASDFFANSKVNLLTNANNRSIYTMLTCLNGYFLNLENASLAENLMEASNGGAIAVWSSTGLTTPDVQEAMGQRFYNQLGLGNITRVGDLIKDAKTAVPGAGNIRLSWVLLGDPMLKVR